jgi:hypothetical protein
VLEVVVDFERYDPSYPLPPQSEPVRPSRASRAKSLAFIQCVNGCREETSGPSVSGIEILPYAIHSIRELRITGRIRLRVYNTRHFLVEERREEL